MRRATRRKNPRTGDYWGDMYERAFLESRAEFRKAAAKLASATKDRHAEAYWVKMFDEDIGNEMAAVALAHHLLALAIARVDRKAQSAAAEMAYFSLTAREALLRLDQYDMRK